MRTELLSLPISELIFSLPRMRRTVESDCAIHALTWGVGHDHLFTTPPTNRVISARKRPQCSMIFTLRLFQRHKDIFCLLSLGMSQNNDYDVIGPSTFVKWAVPFRIRGSEVGGWIECRHFVAAEGKRTAERGELVAAAPPSLGAGAQYLPLFVAAPGLAPPVRAGRSSGAAPEGGRLGRREGWA